MFTHIFKAEIKANGKRMFFFPSDAEECIGNLIPSRLWVFRVHSDSDVV